MNNIKFLNTAARIKKDPNTGENGVIQYLNLEIDESPNTVGWGSFPGAVAEQPTSLKMVTKSKAFALQRFQVKANLPEQLNKDLLKLHGVDGSEMVKSALDHEMDQTILKNLLSKYDELSEITKKSSYTKWQKIVLRYFPKTIFSHYIDENRQGVEKLYSKIISESNKIRVRSRIKPANFIVCGSQIGSIIQDHPGFSYESMGGNIMLQSEIVSHIGIIAGRVQVFVNANQKFNDGSVILGRMTNPQESGVYFIYGDRENATYADPISMKGNLITIQKAAIVSTDGAEKSFSKIHFIVGKRPWWKKLFNI